MYRIALQVYHINFTNVEFVLFVLELSSDYFFFTKTPLRNLAHFNVRFGKRLSVKHIRAKQ